MTKTTLRFSSPDSSQALTIVAAQGKRGINVKASIKDGKLKGGPKAQTGCRKVVQSEQDARSAIDAMVKEAVKAGWTKVTLGDGTHSSKNAFVAIPAPVKQTGVVPKISAPAKQQKKVA